MPSEIRYILFNETEVRRALVKYAHLKKKTIRFEHISEVAYSGSSKITVRVMLKHPGDDRLVPVEFSNADLGAAMIIFCRDTYVPLPNSAVKTLHVDEDTLVLSIMMDDRGQPPELTGKYIMDKVRNIISQ